jgi:hypothetical protein
MVFEAIRHRDAAKCSAALAFADSLKSRAMPSCFPIPHIGWARAMLAELTQEHKAMDGLRAAYKRDPVEFAHE